MKKILFEMCIRDRVQSVRHVENRAVVVFSDSQTGEAFGLEADDVLLLSLIHI